MISIVNTISLWIVMSSAKHLVLVNIISHELLNFYIFMCAVCLQWYSVLYHYLIDDFYSFKCFFLKKDNISFLLNLYWKRGLYQRDLPWFPYLKVILDPLFYLLWCGTSTHSIYQCARSYLELLIFGWLINKK